MKKHINTAFIMVFPNPNWLQIVRYLIIVRSEKMTTKDIQALTSSLKKNKKKKRRVQHVVD